MTRNGTTSFNDKSGKRADTALSKFRYVTQIKSDSKATKSVSKQVDKIDLAKRKAEKFADSHKAIEIRNEIAYIEVYLKSLKAYVWLHTNKLTQTQGSASDRGFFAIPLSV